MDLDRLDAVARSLASAGSRRSLLGMLAAVPVAGGLLARLAPEDAEAKERRRRRKQRHKRRKNPGRNKKKGCKPRGRGKVCAGRCGLVTNRQTCGKTVDCGSCACPEPCGACLICQTGPNTVGACVPDPAQDGQVCAGGVCDGGACVACSASNPCPSGCCDPATGTCVADCPSCQICDSGVCAADPSLQRQVCAGSGATTSICCNGVCCDGCCDGEGTCGACLAFVTGDPRFTAILGGLDGADAICQTRADANTLPGTYAAWLSIGDGPNESPASGRFRHSGQPYTRLDGVTIADDWADLISGSLDAPLNVSETGTAAGPGTTVWTNTRADGTTGGDDPGADCLDWSTMSGIPGNVGDIGYSSAQWTERSSNVLCWVLSRLYCFQQE
ncbi:MAG: hypothetical protein U0075_14720 [Thermomicrobiales bacterium]